MAVCLVRHHLQHAARMARVEANEGNLARRQRIPEPDGQRAGFHPNPFEIFGPFRKPAGNCIRACRHLGFGQKPTIPIHNANRRFLLRHVQRCKYTHGILHVQAASTAEAATYVAPHLVQREMAITLSGVGDRARSLLA
jgi:hypothetical protein